MISFIFYLNDASLNTKTIIGTMRCSYDWMIIHMATLYKKYNFEVEKYLSYEIVKDLVNDNLH